VGTHAERQTLRHTHIYTHTRPTNTCARGMSTPTAPVDVQRRGSAGTGATLGLSHFLGTSPAPLPMRSPPNLTLAGPGGVPLVVAAAAVAADGSGGWVRCGGGARRLLHRVWHVAGQDPAPRGHEGVPRQRTQDQGPRVPCAPRPRQSDMHAATTAHDDTHAPLV
jgi:hypothetical protein